MKNIVRDTYNKIAEQYALSRHVFNNTRHLEKLCSLLPLNATVLDLGCGSGSPVDVFLTSRGFKVVGLDIAEKQIELARINVPQGTYFVRDVSELKLEEFSVEAVVSFYAIFHIPRDTHGDLFKKINSFLRPGGILLVTMAPTDWEGVSEDFYGHPMYESHYARSKNSELVQAAGFEILSDEIDGVGGESHQVILARKM